MRVKELLSWVPLVFEASLFPSQRWSYSIHFGRKNRNNSRLSIRFGQGEFNRAMPYNENASFLVDLLTGATDSSPFEKVR